MMIWVGDVHGGSLVPEDEALVSVLDHGFTVADGIFETMKVTFGVPFALTRHLHRLTASAQAMRLPDPDQDLIRGAVDEVLLANEPVLGPLGRLRITYTAGDSPLGSERGNRAPTLVIASSPTTPWPPVTSIVTVPWVRNERSAIAGVKSTSYGENVVALIHAHSRGASEAVFANTRGELCEGTGTNVFVVIGGEVCTPPLTSGCLAGVTRGLVIKWCEVTERTLDYGLLATADEVFLTSSTRDVHPVVAVDDRVWSGPGVVSEQIRRTFADRCAGDSDPK